MHDDGKQSAKDPLHEISPRNILYMHEKREYPCIHHKSMQAGFQRQTGEPGAPIERPQDILIGAPGTPVCLWKPPVSAGPDKADWLRGNGSQPKVIIWCRCHTTPNLPECLPPCVSNVCVHAKVDLTVHA